jgi:hypothetical protein
MQEIQDLRAKVVVPGGRALHDYANLYICPRNPMLLRRRNMHAEICVLRVSVKVVVDLRNVVVTDSNAASKYARFRPAPGGLAIVDQDRTFADWWTHDDQVEQWRHQAQKCAEVLVPDFVPGAYVFGAYVSNEGSGKQLRQLAPRLAITVDAKMFFQ